MNKTKATYDPIIPKKYLTFPSFIRKQIRGIREEKLSSAASALTLQHLLSLKLDINLFLAR